MLRFLTLACTLSVCATATPAAKPPPVDTRAVALFDRAINGLKKYRSFTLAAEESTLDSSPPKKSFASGSLQWPYRAKLSITSGNVRSQALVGRDQALFWNGGETTTVPLKTQAERERQILRVFESSPSLALGTVSLRAGINPARAAIVKSADYARVAGGSIQPPIASGEPFYFRIRLTRATQDPAHPLRLTYFFSKYARLDRLEITGATDGRVSRTRADFDPLYFNSNAMSDQASTDRYVYGWENPSP